MPLSEHEQRLLDQIEQALYAEDPKFASAVRSARTRSRGRRSLVLGAAGVAAGLALVLVGLVANVIVLSVFGFVLLVASAAYAAQLLRHRMPAVETEHPSARSSSKPAGLRSRMEDRLRRRFEEN